MPQSAKSFQPWAVWRPHSPELAEDAFDRMKAKLPILFADSRIVMAHVADLPFYKTYQLVELVLSRYGTVSSLYLLCKSDSVLWLSGRSNPIHDANEAEYLCLYEDTVESYLRFFLCFLRGPKGYFELTESPDEFPDIPGGDPAVAEKRAIIRAAIIPLTKQGTQDGRWIFAATMASQGIFARVSLAVTADGQVEMVNDDPVASSRTEL